MDRVYESGAVASPPAAPVSPSSGYPSPGDAVAGVRPTVPGPWWFHQVTEELCGLIEALGGTLDGTVAGQLAGLFKNKVGTIVGSISELRGLDKTKYTQALVVGYYAAGDVPLRHFYFDATDTTTADNGINCIVATDGGRWKWVPSADYLDARDSGAKLDGTTDVSADLIAAAQVSPVIALGANANAPSLSCADKKVADVLFKGSGSLIGPYRKISVPDVAPSDYLVTADIVPKKHLVTFNRAPTPVVALIGDSISTYFANSIARSDMLANTLRGVLEDRTPNGITFYDRGIGGKTFSNLFNSQYDANIPWYQGHSSENWIDLVKDLNPDLVVVSFGMNDSSTASIFYIKSLIDYIQTWTKVPSIVFCTNLVPSPASTAHPDGQSGQEGRDAVAGLVRSYAKYRGCGVIDIHRKYCMVRDGYDPVSSVIGNIESITKTGTNNYIQGTRMCRDWKMRVTVDASVWADGKYITLKTGSGANDFIQIIRTNASTMGISIYCGGVDSVGWNAPSIAYTWPTTAGYIFTVEKSGNHVTIYTDTDASAGGYIEPIFFGKIASMGALYLPILGTDAADQAILQECDFAYGSDRINLPSATNTKLWGNETPGGIDTYGGSGYNHPSGWVAAYVYRPVIEAVNWGERVMQSGWASVAAGITSLTVTLPYQEPDTLYFPQLTEQGAGLGATFRVSNVQQGYFVISFSGATTGSGTITWNLVRPAS